MSRNRRIRLVRIPSKDEGRLGYRPPKAVVPTVKGGNKPKTKPSDEVAQEKKKG